jgi:two-component system sensor histidine kinase FlrB
MSEHPICTPQQLQEAFEAFSQLSRQLEASYGELEARVASLTNELAAARSERVRQLAEKEQLADQLTTLLDALPGGVVVLDGAGTVRQCNPAALDLLGEPLLGETWDRVTKRVLMAGENLTHEVRLADGRQVSISRRTLDTQPGQILLLHDVTETRVLQDMVHRQQRLSAMGEMTARVAHQLRTPLSSSLLYASHLASGRLSPADQIRFSERLRSSLLHLDRMVNDMLVFARGGKQGAAPVTLQELLARVEQDVAAPLAMHGASLLLTNDLASQVLEVNLEAFSGAISNLITNAAQAGATRIELSAQRPDDCRLRVEVTDDGPGISDAVRDRIFEPFFTTRPEGTGLGLAVVQAVVQSHDGEICLETNEQGGARFVVELPLARMDQALPGGESTEDWPPLPFACTGTDV